MLPTFLIAGAAKCGSSTLYDHLRQHPDILLSREKEPAFFCHHWERGPDWYAGCFPPLRGQRAIGEATVEYMVDPRVPERIAAVCSDIRLVFILRDPYARAASHYWHRVKRGQEADDIDRVLAAGVDAYPIRYGRYATHIRRFLALFPRPQLHLIVMEELAAAPSVAFAALFRFLGVSDQVPIAYLGARNAALAPRIRGMQRALKLVQQQPLAQALVPDALRPLVAGCYRTLMAANLRPLRVPPLADAQRALLREVFTPEIEGIEALLGRPIPSWSHHDGAD